MYKLFYVDLVVSTNIVNSIVKLTDLHRLESVLLLEPCRMQGAPRSLSNFDTRELEPCTHPYPSSERQPPASASAFTVVV
jgi:hypothetical protein